MYNENMAGNIIKKKLSDSARVELRRSQSQITTDRGGGW
jgi:hypothetical protein